MNDFWFIIVLVFINQAIGYAGGFHWGYKYGKAALIAKCPPATK